jgi:small subunit ribosomal protein S12
MNSYTITSYIPGIGHNLRKHSLVLIQGGGCRDLPGVNYKCIRGVFDFSKVLNRNNRRSIYGIPRPDHLKLKVRRKFRQI